MAEAKRGLVVIMLVVAIFVSSANADCISCILDCFGPKSDPKCVQQCLTNCDEPMFPPSQSPQPSEVVFD